MRGFVVSLVLLSATLCSAQNNISDASDVTVTIVLTGATTLPTAEREQIIREVSDKKMDAGQIYTHEFDERLRDAFQKRGYFKAEIQDAEWGPVTGTGKHREATVKVAVRAGSLYRLGTITFHGNKLFDSQKLRAAFPMADGDIFNVEHMRSGLKALRQLYYAKGYIDFVPVPNTEFNDEANLINVLFDIDEGKQYHVGPLTLDGIEPYAGAGKELLEAWAPHIGEIYDSSAVGVTGEGQLTPPYPAFVAVMRKCHVSGLDVYNNTATNTLDFHLEFPDRK